MWTHSYEGERFYVLDIFNTFVISNKKNKEVSKLITVYSHQTYLHYIACQEIKISLCLAYTDSTFYLIEIIGIKTLVNWNLLQFKQYRSHTSGSELQRIVNMDRIYLFLKI